MSRRILVPLDDSPQSWDALEHVLTEHPDADVVALHVVDPVEWMSAGAVESGGYYSPELYEDALERSEELLERAVERAAEHGVDLATVTETGRPKRVIVEYAEDNDVDHIVMGSHGRAGIPRIFLGSVAEAVLRRSAVPVTVFR